LIAFLQATGLRRREVTMLQVVDVGQFGDQVEIHVRNGKGGRERRVLALPGAEDAVRAVVAGKAPEARVFDHIPSALDVHSYRRGYAQALYRWKSGRELPPATGRLPAQSYDPKAVELVSHNLGHARIDVVLRHYLR
ncbi:MAG TPA: integrase, partial [Chloroflexota bacterium]